MRAACGVEELPGAIAAGGLLGALRTVYLAGAGLALVVAGVLVLLAEEPMGLVYLVCGGAVLVFLPRRGITTAIGVLIALDGLWGWRTSEIAGGLLGPAWRCCPHCPALRQRWREHRRHWIPKGRRALSFAPWADSS